MPTVMDLYTKVTRLPQGRRIFSLLFSQKAPYFATVRPRFAELRPNYAELSIRKRRGVRKDGTVVIEGVIKLWVTEKPAKKSAEQVQ